MDRYKELQQNSLMRALYSIARIYAPTRYLKLVLCVEKNMCARDVHTVQYHRMCLHVFHSLDQSNDVPDLGRIERVEYQGAIKG